MRVDISQTNAFSALNQVQDDIETMRKGFKLPKTKPLEKPYHKANDVMNDLSRMHNVAKIKDKQLTLQDKFKLVEKVKIKPQLYSL